MCERSRYDATHRLERIGRVGRALYRAPHRHLDVEVVAINDLADGDARPPLQQTRCWHYAGDIKATASELWSTETIRLFAEREPARLPWSDLGMMWSSR
jgi:glyceraldehyde 3-phosphate dehydrogenase